MTDYSVQALKQEIRIAIDQNKTSTALTALQDVDTLSMEDIIESKIVDAARMVEREAPYILLDGGEDIPGNNEHTITESITWHGGSSSAGVGSGEIALPNDFLRLVGFKMSDWSYAVTEPIGSDSPIYAQQHSRYAGVRGCPQKPVVAIVMRPEGMVLEFYACSAGSGVTVERAHYIPMPTITHDSQDTTHANDTINICEKCKPAIVYYAAYMTALSIGDATLAAAMFGICKQLMGIENTPQIPQQTQPQQ